MAIDELALRLHLDLPEAEAAMFGKWFGSKKPPALAPQAEAALIDDLLRKAETGRRLAVLLEPTTSPTATKLGGVPDLGEDTSWPMRNGHPLAFLAQLDLAEIKNAGGIDWLPAEGRLFFFFDTLDPSTGFRPEDKDHWAVLFRPLPVPVDGAIQVPPLPKGAHFMEQPLAPRRTVSLPSLESLGAYEARLSKQGWRRLEEEFSESDEAGARHIVGGYPEAIQADDMELECELASNGVHLDGAKDYPKRAAHPLAPNADDWQLLLQIDSDEISGMNWFDAGRLYFFVRGEDAQNGDFSKTWVVIQFC